MLARNSPANLLALNAHEYEVVQFDVPRGPRTRLHYVVNASSPVTVLLLDRKNLSLFERDSPYRYYGKRRKRSHDEDVPVTNAGRLSLVIWNEQRGVVAVNYEVELLRSESLRWDFMPERKVVHVVPDHGGAWAVRSEGAGRPTAIFANKDLAVDRAKGIARNASLGQVVVHGRDGRIRYQNTYGEDPIPREPANEQKHADSAVRGKVSRKEETMSRRKVVHVTPDGAGNWVVKSEGTERAAAVLRNKGEAVARAKEIAKSAALGQIKVHGRDGRIQYENTYGDDKCPPEG
jgi:hypothetical protein